MKYIGITDESSFKGYSNTVKSFLWEMDDAKVLDLSSEKFEEKIVSAVKEGNLTLLTSGNIAGEFFKKFVNKECDFSNVNFMFLTDRFYDMNFPIFKEISLIAPEDVSFQYKNVNPKHSIKSYVADLVTPPSKFEIDRQVVDFMGCNPFVSGMVSLILGGNGKAFFVGGRVALEDGSFKENTEEIFAKAGKDFVRDGRNGVVIFHGLRSFTKGDKTNDFAPVNAFYNAVRSSLQENQIVAFISKILDKKGNRLPYFFITMRDGKDVVTMNYDMSVSKYPAGDYYFLLNEVVKRGLDLTATVEQMNFISEALELGADKEKLKPYLWDLSVESNLDVYRKLKRGDILKNQKQVFNNLMRLDSLVKKVSEKQR